MKIGIFLQIVIQYLLIFCSHIILTSSNYILLKEQQMKMAEWNTLSIGHNFNLLLSVRWTKDTILLDPVSLFILSSW